MCVGLVIGLPDCPFACQLLDSLLDCLFLFSLCLTVCLSVCWQEFLSDCLFGFLSAVTWMSGKLSATIKLQSQLTPTAILVAAARGPWLNSSDTRNHGIDPAEKVIVALYSRRATGNQTGLTGTGREKDDEHDDTDQTAPSGPACCIHGVGESDESGGYAVVCDRLSRRLSI